MEHKAERAAVHGVSTSKGETQGTKKVLVKPKDEMLGGVGAAAAWAKASRRGGEADWETWHERLGHVNFPMLQRLVKSGSIKGVKVKGPIKDEGSCPTCLECKFSKFPFEKARGGRREPLAFVHMDVVDPRCGPSLDGCHYFLTIVDDFTRAVWAYPLKNKGDVPGVVLEEWLPRAQRESGHKVKAILSDNGGEFKGAHFEGELRRRGITHFYTDPYNPQQNGVAERYNRTLQEGLKALLHRAGLPNRCWVAALRHMVAVKNRVFTTVGDKEWVPYTRWYGSAPVVDMLRAFGCMAVFHVPREKREKMDPSGRWGVHLGLAKDCKGWLIWDITTQKLTISRDVKFLEALYYKEWKRQQGSLPTTPLMVEREEEHPRPHVVQFDLSDSEVSEVTEEEDASDEEEPEQPGQQGEEQQTTAQGAAPPPARPKRAAHPPQRLKYVKRGRTVELAGGAKED